MPFCLVNLFNSELFLALFSPQFFTANEKKNIKSRKKEDLYNTRNKTISIIDTSDYLFLYKHQRSAIRLYIGLIFRYSTAAAAIGPASKRL
jgi:hypothetical protein